ncbi:MAG: hypothetical protein RL722_215 [Pseudomonadota bacterium]|jgi:carbonic anhydrase/acetyltransferase-like protein (isoleucine patch superfamily)
MTVYRLGELRPTLAPDAWVAAEATVVGDVTLGPLSSVWFGAAVRGDNAAIRVGARSNVQEGAVLHVDPGYPMAIGDGVTIGHQAMLHGCTVGDHSLIGIQAVVLNGAVIGAESLVGAGAVVTQGKQFPPRSMILGAPAKLVRSLTEDEVAGLHRSAETYVGKTERYGRELQAVDARSGADLGPSV